MSIAYVVLFLTSHVVLVGQGVRGNNTAPSACTLLGLGASLCCWGLAPLQLLTSGASGAWHNFGENNLLLLPVCLCRGGRGGDPWRSNEDEGKRRGAYVFLCVFLRAASGSCGVRSRRVQASPVVRTLSILVLSLSVLATRRHQHILGRRGTTLGIPASSAASPSLESLKRHCLAPCQPVGSKGWRARAVPGLSGLWPRGGNGASESLLAGS